MKRAWWLGSGIKAFGLGRGFTGVGGSVLIVVVGLACNADAGATSSRDTSAGGDAERMGVMLDINLKDRQLSITRIRSDADAPSEMAAMPSGSRARRPSLSLLQSDVIGINISNYRFSTVGASGKIRVTFEVTIQNQLSGVTLQPPNFYLGSQSPTFLMLFPLLAKAELTTGEANRDPDGILAIDAPGSSPPIEPSPDWDGAALSGRAAGYDFGVDTVCTTTAPGCTRWKAFPSLNPGEVSPARTVGFDLDPAVSRFKVLLVLAADLGAGTAPTDTSTLPGLEDGIPFGPFHLPADSIGTDFSGALMNGFPNSLFDMLRQVHQRGGRIVLNFAVGRRSYTNPDGTFSLELWKQQIDQFKGMDFHSYIDDGTIIAHYLVDEPNCTTCWGGQSIPYATLEEMARYSKSIWPTMPTAVRVHPAWLRYAPFLWQYLDIAWAQYEGPQHIPSYGLTPEQFRDQNVLEAQALGLALILGQNVLDGGDGSSGIHGATIDPTRWQMTPAEYTRAGLVFAATPYACAVIDWRWSPTYPEKGYTDEQLQTIRAFHMQPETWAAVRRIAAVARTRAATPCRRS